MSVLIKGMEMPNGCITCRMECIARIHDSTKRSKNCPLVYVPTPHGRLIDESKIKKCGWNFIEHHAKTDAPTIIEAESEESQQTAERDCEHCVHRKDKGCEKWDCEFERKTT